MAKWVLVGVYFIVGAVFCFPKSIRSNWFDEPNVPHFVELVDKAIPLFLLSIVVELVVSLKGEEKPNPSKSSPRDDGSRLGRYYRINDGLNSMSLGTLQQTLHVIGPIKSLQIVPYLYVWEHMSSPALRFESDSISSWIICFFLVDFAYYWYHRMGHEVNCFWAAHVAHHSSEEYNLTTALRQGAIQYSAAFLFYAPIGLLVAPEVFSVHAHLNRLFQFWIHTQAIDKMPKWFEYVFNTPSHHRVHHAANEIYIDKNYGGTLILFDRLFNTFQEERADTPCKYGLTHNINSWNPVWANVHHWRDVWRLASQQKSWKTSLSILWVGPGWTPDGPLPIPPADVSSPKYDRFGVTKIGSVYMLMLLVEAVVLLKVLTRQSGENVLFDCAYFVFIVWTLLSIGFFLDSRNFVAKLELLRILCLSFCLFYFSGSLILPVILCMSTPLIYLTPRKADAKGD